MGIEGVENLTDEQKSAEGDESSEPQPGADDPTPTTDPSVPGDEPVQQQFETPSEPDADEADDSEDVD